MGKIVKTSINLDGDVWMRFKVKCVKENRRYSDVLAELIEKWGKG